MASATSTTSVESKAEPLIVLILIGLIASGKVRNFFIPVCVQLTIISQSTFAQALETHFPNFRRCSQDDLGNRPRVERLARQCLQQGLSVCIDRTNFDPSSVLVLRVLDAVSNTARQAKVTLD
jgi:hypothetical protein